MGTPVGQQATILTPKKILSYVCEGEETLWKQRDLSENQDDLVSNASSDISSKLIRSGKTVKKIHTYFGNLEPRKCCLFLAGCKTTFNNVRLVRSDGRDSGIEEGAMMKIPSDKASDVAELDDVDLRVFRRAYMCASFPVLCVPEPPPALTPSPETVPEEDSKWFQIGGKIAITRVATPDTMQDSGVEEADDMSIVPAETLFELLRRAYRLGQDKFSQYEVAIFHQHGKKESSKILAEELVNQLAALENNKNPFYNPDRFFTPQAYDNWQIREFGHIAELMKKFWNFAYPQHTTNFAKNLQTAHADYKLLMEKLLRYESVYRSGEIHTTGPVSPLSSASVRLLREYGLRYGIGELYRKLVYLQYLASHFDPTVAFIQHICATLTTVIDMIPPSGCRHVMVDTEYKLFEESLNALETRAGTTIFKMKALFPYNRPSDGLETLFDLIKLTQRGKNLLINGRAVVVKEFLLSNTQTIFPTCYNEHKMVVMKDLQQNDQIITPTLLNMMIGKLRDEVRDYLCNYQNTFDRYFNITEMAAQSLYSLLMDDVIRLFQYRQDYPRKMAIDKQMLGLGYRLKQLDNDWSMYIPAEAQVWREWFHKEQLHWTTVLKIALQHMVVDSVSQDKFENEKLQVKPFFTTPSSSLSDHRNRSISLTPSLTPSLTSAFSELPSSCQSTPEHPIYRTQHTTLLHEVIVHPVPPQSAPNPQSVLRADSSSPAVPSAFQKVQKEKIPHLASSLTEPISFVKYEKSSTLNYDTQSLTELENDDSVMTFGGIRRGSSMPEMLSKSYDHTLKIMRPNVKPSQPLPGEEKSKTGKDDENKVDRTLNSDKVDKNSSPPHSPSAPGTGNKGDKPGSEDKDNEPGSENNVVEPGTENKNSELGSGNRNSELETGNRGSETGKRDNEGKFSTEQENTAGNVTNVENGSDSSTPVNSIEGDNNDDKKKVLEENAQKYGNIRNTAEDKDSLAGEFLDEVVTMENVSSSTSSDSDSEKSDSPVVSFPPVSVVALDNKSLEDTPLEISDPHLIPVPSDSIKGFHSNQVVVPTSRENVKATITDTSKLRVNPIASTPVSSVDSSHPSQKTSVDAIAPVSNSVIDLIVVLQRVLGFGKTLCQTFYQIFLPRQNDFENSLSSSTSHDSAASFHSAEMRRRLYDKFLEGVCNMLTVYADNILCMDICGTTLSVAKRLAGVQMVEYLQTQRQSDLIWGCRHDVHGIKDCFEFVNKKTKFLCDRHEPVTKDMCTRINNVCTLLSYVAVYHDKLGRVFDITEDWKVNQHGSSSSDENQKEYVVGKFGYNPGADLKGVVETGSQRVPVGSVRFNAAPNSLVQSPTDSCVRHLMAVLRAQSRFMAYRINLFIYDAMCILLALKEPDAPVSTSLGPLNQFLSSYVDSLEKWLYPDNFRRVMECLWIFVVQDFEEELAKLRKNESSDNNAHLLIQALTHLMRFMNNEDRGIRRKLLLPQAETVMFKLQLYAAPSSCLILLHRKLLELYFNSEISSTCTLDNTIQMILQKLRQDLLVYRKCFSGSQLVTWIRENPNLFSFLDSSPSARDLSQKRADCVALAQHLMDISVIVDVDSLSWEQNDLDDLDMSFEDYPELSIMGNLTQRSIDVEDDDVTPTVTPRVTPVPKSQSSGLNTSLREHLKKGESIRRRHTRSSNFSPRHTPVPKGSLRSQTSKTRNQNHGARKVVQNEDQGHRTDTDRPRHMSHGDDVVDNGDRETDKMKSDGHPHMLTHGQNNFMNSCSTSPVSTLEGEKFQDSHSHFYRLVSFTHNSNHRRSEGTHSKDSEELDVLVEQCFQMKVVPEFVKDILNSRKRYDPLAHQYVLSKASNPDGSYANGDIKQGCDIS